MRIQFDQFQIDLDQKSVIGPDGPVSLRPQTFAVLCHLIDQAPAVVSRDDLLDAVWGHQATSVSSVAQTIKELRQALGDSSSEPRLIATRRRLGYQFIAPIQHPDANASADHPPQHSGYPTPSTPPAPPPTSFARQRSWAALALVALLVLAVWFFAAPGNQPAWDDAQPPTLAVAQMVNATDDPSLNWLGPALETYLGHALVELGGFRVLVIDPTSSRDEAQLTDVDFLIEGRYLTAGVDGSRLLASLRRPGSSEIVTSLESGLGGWDVAALSIEMAGAIRDRLGFSPPPGADATAIRARLPRVADSQRLYFSALNALELNRADQALALIAEARTDEPNNPRLDHLEAMAWQRRGDWDSAREASEKALAATRLWPRRDRLELEATAALLEFDYERAADSLQALTQFYPEPESSRRLVDALIQAGRLGAAEQALASLASQRPSDPRVALLQARLAQAERLHEKRLEAAREAILLARQDNLDALLPAALLSEVGALIELARLDEAREVLDDLFDLTELLSDADLAYAHLSLARIRFQQGELAGALEASDDAFALFAAIPHPLGQAETRMVAGAIHDRAGRLEESLVVLEEALGHFEALGDTRRLAQATVQTGVTLMRANQTDRAIDHFERGARQFRRQGDRQGEGAALLNHATLLARSGRLVDAEPPFERALEAFTDAGDLRGQAIALGNLAGISSERRDYSRSIAQAEQALELFDQLGAQTDIARVSFNLGILHRRRGELTLAQARFEQAADAFAQQGATLMEARALTTLGSLMLSTGRLDDLEELLGRVGSLDIEDAVESSLYQSLIGEHALAINDLSQARAAFESAHDLLVTIAAEDRMLASRYHLAKLDLAEGNAVRAEQTARELVTGFGEVRNGSRQIDALILLAESLISQQRLTDASASISRAEDLLETYPDAEQGLRLAVLRSQVSEPELAMQRLDWVEQQAATQGFVPLLEQSRALRRY
ncbi:MAG: tetratricopeptide repeat protein [Wenzhouxiangella sp.]